MRALVLGEKARVRIARRGLRVRVARGPAALVGGTRGIVFRVGNRSTLPLPCGGVARRRAVTFVRTARRKVALRCLALIRGASRRASRREARKVYGVR